MAEFSEDGLIYRGTIKSMHGNTSTVQFIDYGNQAVTANEKIFQYDWSKFGTFAGTAFDVRIQGIDLSNADVLDTIEKLGEIAINLTIVGEGEFLECSTAIVKDGPNLRESLGLLEKPDSPEKSPSEPKESKFEVPFLKMVGRNNFPVQPYALYAPNNAKPSITFCDENFDFDASADFNTSLSKHAQGKFYIDNGSIKAFEIFNKYFYLKRFEIRLLANIEIRTAEFSLNRYSSSKTNNQVKFCIRKESVTPRNRPADAVFG